MRYLYIEAPTHGALPRANFVVHTCFLLAAISSNGVTVAVPSIGGGLLVIFASLNGAPLGQILGDPLQLILPKMCIEIS